jgi:3-phenylpropionate/cinnamic acid dioxygenase small subunit
MTAEEQITSLINRYAITVDSGDLDEFIDLFEKGEWYVDGLDPNKGPQEIFDNVISKIIIYADGTPRTRHVTTNVELEIDDKKGTAKGQRYVTVLQQTDELPLQPIFSGHYFDEFVKDGGTWRFAKTVVHNPLVGDMSQHLKATEFISGDD